MGKQVRVPKYVVKKIERMNRLMQEIVDLNIEVEGWIEANGCENAFDLSVGYRDDRGYGISGVDGFLSEVERVINGGGEDR